MTSTDRTATPAVHAPAPPSGAGEPGLVSPGGGPGPGSPPRHRCGCGHLDVFHNYGKRCGVKVRTGCSVSDGAKAVPCGCQLYEEAS